MKCLDSDTTLGVTRYIQTCRYKDKIYTYNRQRTFCHRCNNEWRKQNIDKARGHGRRANYKKSLIIHYNKMKPCADCKDFYPTYVLDFDHVKGTKLFNIGAEYVTVGKQRLIDEIAKCEVVCANCHRIRTYELQKRSENGEVE